MENTCCMFFIESEKKIFLLQMRNKGIHIRILKVIFLREWPLRTPWSQHLYSQHLTQKYIPLMCFFKLFSLDKNTIPKLNSVRHTQGQENMSKDAVLFFPSLLDYELALERYQQREFKKGKKSICIWHVWTIVSEMGHGSLF